jgi:Flp pilus assembly protein TadG
MMRFADKTPRTRFLRDRRGATATLVALSIPVLFGTAVIAIDLGNLHNQRTLLQIAADSAALAGAWELNAGGNPVTTAKEYANDKNSSQLIGTILVDGDVVVGRWDTATRTVDPAGTPQNAVQVTTRRSQANGNPVQMYFAALLGYDTMDVNARAVAIAGGDNDSGPGDCWQSGAMAGGSLSLGQDVNLQTTCIYGQDGVSLGQNAYVGPEAAVGMPNCADYPDDCADFNVGQGGNIQGNVLEMDLSGGAMVDDPTQTQQCILNFIDMLKGGSANPGVECGDVWPSHITSVAYDTSATTLPASLSPGTAYIFHRSILIDQSYTLTDNFIISENDINWGQNGRIRNSVDSCVDYTETTIGIFAVDNVSIGQNAVVDGAALWAGRDMQIGQNVAQLGASLRAGRNMNITQDPDFEGCEVNFNDTLGTGGGAEEQVVRLVK